MNTGEPLPCIIEFDVQSTNHSHNYRVLRKDVEYHVNYGYSEVVPIIGLLRPKITVPCKMVRNKNIPSVLAFCHLSCVAATYYREITKPTQKH